MKIAILYIATGRYTVFWKDFYESCENFFLPGYEKTYFMFTDNEYIEYQNNSNVRKIHQEKLGWPNDTLMRFEMFLKAEEELKTYDYIYFINGTMLPVSPVNEEILPSEEQQLMVTLHPGFYKCNRKTYTYDNNPKSLAYISEDRGEFYFMGGFNGGTSKAFLKLCRDLDNAIKEDLENNIIALWHDESHLNKYMLDKRPLMLTPDYGFPEGMPFNREHLKEFEDKIKMLIKDKNLSKYGGHDWLRGLADDKKKPKVSVMMPVYNTKEEYLREAIESILNQTYKDYELIILNDGSTNNVKEIVLSYQSDHIKYYENECNKGLAYSRNRLLSIASGEYLAWMDSDDISMPERLKEEVQYMDENPNVGVLGTWFEYFPEYFLLKFPTKNIEIKREMISGNNIIGNSTAMMRMRVIRKESPQFKKDLAPIEDYDFWMQLFSKTDFGIIPRSLLKYRRHENNISNVHKKRNEKILQSIIKTYKKKYYGFYLLNIKIQKFILKLKK